MNHAADIEAQASRWLVRLDAADQAADNAEFTAWLSADPRHRAAYLRLAAAWERSARLKSLRPEGGVIDADLLRGSMAKPRSFWRAPLALAAGLASLAIVAAGGWLLIAHDTDRYRTEVGGLSRVLLNDGSTVTLNTDTELRVRLGESRREVQLLRGEAQFAVAHDAARPFEVFAGGRIVRAIGTAFNVRLDPDKALEVIVTEGRVALVDNLATPATVSAGESATAVGAQVTVRRVSATETSRHLAWQAGELSFQGETLAQAVAEFNRYNRRKLIIGDAAIGSLQIGGNFQALDVDSFVAALNRSFAITAKTRDDGTVVLERAPRPP